jgi:hypothetical protein
MEQDGTYPLSYAQVEGIANIDDDKKRDRTINTHDVGRSSAENKEHNHFEVTIEAFNQYMPKYPKKTEGAGNNANTREDAEQNTPKTPQRK